MDQITIVAAVAVVGISWLCMWIKNRTLVDDLQQSLEDSRNDPPEVRIQRLSAILDEFLNKDDNA